MLVLLKSLNIHNSMVWGQCLFFIEIKGIVNFEMNFWYFLASIKGIQDVGVFVSAVFQF